MKQLLLCLVREQVKVKVEVEAILIVVVDGVLQVVVDEAAVVAAVAEEVQVRAEAMVRIP